jgi:TolA-binding protein
MLEGKHMKTVTLSVLILVSAAFAGLANAQEAPATPTAPPAETSSYIAPEPSVWDGDAWRRIPGPDLVSRMESGVSALKANDFALAEQIFGNVLRRKPASADANFYMGVAKMNLGEWEDAKKHLEIAVRNKPKHPDPKSRLGVTYAKLGDAAGASVQRAALEKMADTCKRSCKDFAPYIAGGIEMIDKALGETAAPGQG